MSTFGRFNYNYKEKYLLEVNGNYQGTYKFARGKRFGFFPSTSVGYRISEEDFWSGLESAVSNLKLRASYGELGNYNTGSLGSVAYLPNMGVNSQVNWVADGGPVVGVFAPGLISPYLTWETVRTLDFG